MLDRQLPIIPITPFEATSGMSLGDLLDVTVPARAFMPKAALDPIDRRVVDQLRDLHELVQRDFAGEKKANAQGALAEYMRHDWLNKDTSRPANGFMGPFIVYFRDKLQVTPDNRAHITSKGMFLDGESRGEAALFNIERMTDDEIERLLHRPVTIHIVHGIDNPEIVAKYFADVNGRGVKVNPNLTAMRDFTDQYTRITQIVFAELGIELETRQRQVRAKSDAVLTGLQARLMVAAIARGVAVVQYGAKAIPDEGVDFPKLRSAAKAWLTQVFTRFPATTFRDKTLVLRSVPVTISIGAVGRGFYEGDQQLKTKAVEILTDKRIDWMVGPRWSGVAGKVNPVTDKFAVGGGKEYVYATYKALTEDGSNIWEQVRGIRKAA